MHSRWLYCKRLRQRQTLQACFTVYLTSNVSLSARVILVHVYTVVYMIALFWLPQKQRAIQGVSLQFGLQSNFVMRLKLTCRDVHITSIAVTKVSQSALTSFCYTILKHACWCHKLPPESSCLTPLFVEALNCCMRPVPCDAKKAASQFKTGCIPGC